MQRFSSWRSSALVTAIMALIGVCSVFIEFTEDVGVYSKGDITDALKDGVARAFIAGGQGREVNAGDYMRASLAAQAKKANEDYDRFKAEILETVRTGLKPSGTRKPPDGGGGVNFGKLATESTPRAEEDKNRTFSDALRSIALVHCKDAPPVLVEYCRTRLRGYSDEFTEYQVDPETGKIESVQTRQLADGGMETIKRTGTDSLSGGPTYGFTLKPEYIGNLFRIAREATVFEDGCRRMPVSQGNEAIWPALDQFKPPVVVNGIPQAAVFGGIVLSYLGETTARVSSDAATAENRFKIVDMTGMTDFSRDYIVDNYIAMDQEVTRMFGEAIGWIRDWTYLRGDGVAKPQGVVNAASTITSGPNSGGRYHNTSLTSDDLLWMMSRVATMCWQGMRWISNVTNFPTLAILTNKTGTPVFQPNALIDQAMMLSLMRGSKIDEATLVSKPMGVLLGKPLYLTEKLPQNSTTSVGDIILTDPWQYGDATRSGIEMGVSEHFYFSTDRIAYRFKMRHYGKSLWRAPYTQADNIATPGSGTQVSPCVVLNSTTSS